MSKRIVYLLSLTVIVTLVVSATGVSAHTLTAQTAPATTGVLVVSAASQSDTTWTRNFNPFAAKPLWPTTYGVYESLMVYNRIKGELTPWLATAYAWSNSDKTLTFTLRDGVQWSDGKPFAASDVAYTFNLLAKTAGLQGTGLNAVGAAGYVDTVTAPDAKTVVFTFKKVFTPGLYDIVNQVIVPEHIWKDVADPVKFTNDNPVATGPFTQVTNFQTQVYQIDKNPNYWQPGKPAVNGLRLPAYGGNDAVAVAFTKGDIDWAGQFFPNIQTSIIAKNPTDLHYWWPTVGADTLFMVNTTVKPFNDPIVRKAVSMAFNRDQMIKIALNGETQPADVTGLSAGYAAWKVADATKLGDWTTYNVDKANQMLDAAGYKKGADNIRTMSDGTPLKFDLTMVNGFSDWIAVAPVITQNLKAIGISATIKNMDVPVAFDSWTKGSFTMSLFFGIDASSPYTYYRNIMSKDTYVDVGKDAGFGQNFWRYVSPKADDLLTQFASTSDVAKQKDVIQQVQQIFADEAPVIPMWYAPSFFEYNSSRFEGWPTKDNPYSIPLPVQTTPDQLLVMTALTPKK